MEALEYQLLLILFPRACVHLERHLVAVRLYRPSPPTNHMGRETFRGFLHPHMHRYQLSINFSDDCFPYLCLSLPRLHRNLQFIPPAILSLTGISPAKGKQISRTTSCRLSASGDFDDHATLSRIRLNKIPSCTVLSCFVSALKSYFNTKPEQCNEDAESIWEL